MKRILILAIFFISANVAFSNPWPPRAYKNDPSFSVRNYKHQNKAAFAKEQGIEKIQVLENTSTTSNSDQKHPLTTAKKSKKATFAPATGNGHPARSHKHPLG